jgi:Na+/proline symporter
MGFLLFGPLILIGIAGAELTHKKAAATATGFIGWISYLGAATAGYPLGCVTQRFGWEGFFIALTVSAIVTALILLPLWNVGRQPKKAPKQLVAVPAQTPHFAFAEEYFAEQAEHTIPSTRHFFCATISQNRKQKILSSITKSLRVDRSQDR